MNTQSELIHDAFHALAQPATALRATVELALRDMLEPQELRQVLKDCLLLCDRLTQELALFREIASLDEQLPLASCDGMALLAQCVEEMAPVAEAAGITLHLIGEPAVIACHEETFQHAIFFLLDEMIASAESASKISISLRRQDTAYRLELHPAIPHSRRQKLCRKLLQSAGGTSINTLSNGIAIVFREGLYRPVAEPAFANKQFLTSL
jgi:signal transduction histidine kinase